MENFGVFNFIVYNKQKLHSRGDFMNYIYLINEHYPLLTKSERKVADFILNSGESIIYSTMNDIKTKRMLAMQQSFAFVKT